MADTLTPPAGRHRLRWVPRTDNTAAGHAVMIGSQAVMWALLMPLIQWLAHDSSWWRLPPMARGDAAEVINALGMSWLGGVLGCPAVLCGYDGLRRVHAGTVTGGRRRAFIGVVLGALGILVSLAWAALVALSLPH